MESGPADNNQESDSNEAFAPGSQFIQTLWSIPDNITDYSSARLATHITAGRVDNQEREVEPQGGTYTTLSSV